MSSYLGRRTIFVAALAALATLGGVAPSIACADDDDDGDHERARRALVKGELRPLAEILEMVGPKVNGEVIAVELEREDGRFMYELTVITSSGRLREFEVDALTGQVLKVEED